MKFSFFHQRHALLTRKDIFVIIYRVTNFLPKLLDMLLFSAEKKNKKKLNFHFFKSPVAVTASILLRELRFSPRSPGSWGSDCDQYQRTSWSDAGNTSRLPFKESFEQNCERLSWFQLQAVDLEDRARPLSWVKPWVALSLSFFKLPWCTAAGNVAAGKHYWS